MCVTHLDLDLEHEITEDDQPPSPGQPVPGPQPVGGQIPGVAWGRAGPHTAAS